MRGVAAREVLDLAGVRPGADMLLSTSVDGWTCGTPISTVTDGRDALLAVGMNGSPLPLEHGYPVRQVVPGLYGYVSATKWVTDWEVTRFSEAKAYWTTRGWSALGPIKMASRFDRPADGTEHPAGEVVVAGTAWAQHTGVERVEEAFQLHQRRSRSQSSASRRRSMSSRRRRGSRSRLRPERSRPRSRRPRW